MTDGASPPFFEATPESPSPSGEPIAAVSAARSAAAASQLELVAPGYLQRVRRASQRLAHRDSTVIDVVTALADVEDTAALDLEVPMLSRRRSGRLVKMAMKKLVSWYLRYVVQQVAAFSAAVTRFGAVVVERTDQIEEATTALGRDLEGLRRRVERLEGERGPATPSSPPDGDPAG